MRDASSRHWYRWRVTIAASAPVTPVDRFGRKPLASTSPPPAEGDARDEAPAADGIRHGLVARIRQQIADGVYDTDEKWLAAEEELIRRVGV